MAVKEEVNQVNQVNPMDPMIPLEPLTHNPLKVDTTMILYQKRSTPISAQKI